jgi:hypothetical protein
MVEMMRPKFDAVASRLGALLAQHALNELYCVPILISKLSRRGARGDRQTEI